MQTKPRRLGIRARVVTSFVVLLTIAVLVSIGVLQGVGSRRIDAQVTQDLSTAAADLHARLDQRRIEVGTAWRADADVRVRRLPPGPSGTR